MNLKLYKTTDTCSSTGRGVLLGLTDVQSLLTKLTAAVLVAAVFLTLPATSPLAGAVIASSSTGFDISFPQCSEVLPSAPTFGVVGVNGGSTFTTNQCLPKELTWAENAASGTPSFYANTENAGPSRAPDWPTSQQTPRVCSGANSVACSYDYGWNAARVSFAAAVSAETTDGFTSPSAQAAATPWWLDVETGNLWQTIEYGQSAASDAYDQAALEGMLASFENIGVTSIGIYSTPSQWKVITGGTESTFPEVPAWIPGFATLAAAQAGCTSASFLGGRVAMIQYPSRGYDGDFVCGLLSTPVVTSSSVADSPTFSQQLTSTNNSGVVSYVQTSGSPDLAVSTTGLVTTSGALNPGSYVATGTTSDTSGDTGTFSLTLVVGTLIAVAPLSASVKASGSAAFSDQLSVSGSDGAVTWVQTSGSPNLTVSGTGLVTTSGTLSAGTYTASGATSDLSGDTGTFSFILKVGTLVQRDPLTAAVLTTASSTFSDQLSVGANLGTVTYTQVSGSAHLSVSSSGLVTTIGALSAATYTASGTTSDTSGDFGTFTFALKVSKPLIHPVATSVAGHAVAGKTVTLSIHGTGFYGSPNVSSHAGTTAVVIRDTGLVLIVKVTVAPRSRNGVFTFTITLANGESCTIRYNQR
jgi:hypothetical protein